MKSGHMVVEIVPRGWHVATIFAGVGERAGKVNVLHVFAQVKPAVLDYAAQCAAMVTAAVV